MLRKFIIIAGVLLAISTTVFAAPQADITIDKTIKLTWEPCDESIAIWISKGNEILYGNMIKDNNIGELYIQVPVSDGDVIKVELTGGTVFSDVITYDLEKLSFKQMKELLVKTEETAVLELVMKYDSYIGAQNKDKLGSLSSKEEVKLETAILNGTFADFSELDNIIDDTYADILNNRNSNKSSGSSTVGGVSSGSVAIGSTVFENDKIPQPENTYEFERKDPEFVDMKENHWAMDSIILLYNKGVVTGTSENTFSPDKNVTRAEFVRMLVMAYDVENKESKCFFADVKENDWFYSSVATANQLGFVSGKSETEFCPNDNITREDAAVLLYRFMKAYRRTPLEGKPVDFVDEGDISEYAIDAVKKMSGAGFISGVGDNKYGPKSACTRAMAAKMIAAVVFGEVK